MTFIPVLSGAFAVAAGGFLFSLGVNTGTEAYKGLRRASIVRREIMSATIAIATKWHRNS